jgi:hypothetical protein
MGYAHAHPHQKEKDGLLAGQFWSKEAFKECCVVFPNKKQGEKNLC